MRSVLAAAFVVSAFALPGAAYASGDDMLKSGDNVKAIEQDRIRQQEMQGGAQTGRSATEPTTEGGAPLGGKQKEENVLEGVDPAVKPRQ